MLRVLQPTQIAQRIQSLDVLRGFALLGILLLNILSFGLYSAAYANPGFDLIDGNPVDVVAWAVIEVAAEGALGPRVATNTTNATSGCLCSAS